MSDTIDISQQLEEYLQQHPDIAEALYAFQEIQAIYLEAMQIMREADIMLTIAREEAAKMPRNFDEGDKSIARFWINQGYAGI